MSPFTLWLYWRFGHAGQDTGDRGKKPFWQTTFVGDSHCGAGCAPGDFAGEWIVFRTGLTVARSVLWADYASISCSRMCSVSCFSYFAIAPMRNLSRWPGVRVATKANTVSLVAFEVGMFAGTALSSKVFFQPKAEPTQAVYWFSMQIAMVVGLATAYPENWWLI